MKNRLFLAALSATLLFASGTVFAATTAPHHDTMMSTHAMKPCATAKPMAMKHDAMKHDAMKHDAMKHDTMKSTTMKKGKMKPSPCPSPKH